MHPADDQRLHGLSDGYALVERVTAGSSSRGDARILPPHLFALLFAVIVLLIAAQPLDLSVGNLLYNVVMLNGVFEVKGQPFNFPSWSLFYEVVYCLAIPVLLAVSRTTAWPLAVLLGTWPAILIGLGLAGFSGWILFASFVAGSLLAQLQIAG